MTDRVCFSNFLKCNMFLKYTFRILIFLKFLLNLWMEVADSAFNDSHTKLLIATQKESSGWAGSVQIEWPSGYSRWCLEDSASMSSRSISPCLVCSFCCSAKLQRTLQILSSVNQARNPTTARHCGETRTPARSRSWSWSWTCRATSRRCSSRMPAIARSVALCRAATPFPAADRIDNQTQSCYFPIGYEPLIEYVSFLWIQILLALHNYATVSKNFNHPTTARNEINTANSSTLFPSPGPPLFLNRSFPLHLGEAVPRSREEN
jgi:hypothetical protein